MDPEAFVIPQFWEAPDHTVWWDLRYLHVFLKRKGWEQLPRGKWLANKFKKKVVEIGAAFRPPPDGLDDSDSCTADTFALVAFLWAAADVSTDCDKGMQDSFVALVRAMIARATVELRPEHTCLTLENIQCRVYNGGQMSGLHAVTGGHATTGDTVAGAWAALHHAGILNGAASAEQHSVQDVATFFMLVLSTRRARKRRISDGLRRLVDGVRLRMVEWLAGALDAYVLRAFSADNELTENAPPSLKHQSPSKRKYTVVAPEASWDLMEKALQSRANVEQSLRLKDDEDNLGCADKNGQTWGQKKIVMYGERASAVFTCIYHWNLVADPGTHAYKEVMPAVLYGWEIDEACYPSFQYVLPGKGGVTIFDCELETDAMVQMSLEMKLERVATYRQLQGVFRR